MKATITIISLLAACMLEAVVAAEETPVVVPIPAKLEADLQRVAQSYQLNPNFLQAVVACELEGVKRERFTDPKTFNWLVKRVAQTLHEIALYVERSSVLSFGTYDIKRALRAYAAGSWDLDAMRQPAAVKFADRATEIFLALEKLHPWKSDSFLTTQPQ